jgi:hypothetical protein
VPKGKFVVFIALLQYISLHTWDQMISRSPRLKFYPRVEVPVALALERYKYIID